MSIGYAAAQYLKSLSNPAKNEQWQNVLQSMANGSVSVGSRSPVKGFPAWATPQVASGGFATGRMLAGGDLVPHEVDMMRELDERGLLVSVLDPKPDEMNKQRRRTLQEFLTGTEEGLQALSYRLHSKSYRIDVPEEGCLMAYVWLVEGGHIDEAKRLLETVEPFFDRLRFHPAPLASPEDFSRVSISSVDQLLAFADSHRADEGSPVSLKACEVGKIRLLFWDRFVKLWMSTLGNGHTPTGVHVQDSQSTCAKFQVAQESAWPCQSYPPTWDADASSVLDFYSQHAAVLSTTRFYVNAIDLVRRARQDRSSLTGREVGRIRFWLASANVKRGFPGDSRHEQWISNALLSLDADISVPSHHDFYSKLADLIRDKCAGEPSESRRSLAPSDAQDIQQEMQEGMPRSKLLKPLQRRLALVTAMTCDELYASDLVSSPDMMAVPLASFASEALASRVLDDSAQYLHKQLHRCFLGRRSLLLLNFASQTKISELPWVAALDRALVGANAKSADTTAINAFVRRAVGLSMKRYGESPTRNPFVRVLEVLFKATDTQCVLLEELAADIFQGRFVPKFAIAYEEAKRLLAGSCYDRYYDIGEPSSQQENTPTDDNGFSELCVTRAERNQSSTRSSSYVARNGMIIEQAQILTTHNMATLFGTYELGRDLGEWDVPAIIRRGLGLILKKLRRVHNIKTQTAHVTGRIGPLLRDVGGLWRQLVFWFAVLEKFGTHEVYSAMVDELAGAALPGDGRAGCPVEKYQEHFRELLRVLRDREARAPQRVVLGWSA